jgi:hypothetical protein
VLIAELTRTISTGEIAAQLLEALDETLETLGWKTKFQVYDYFEKRIGLKRDDIPSRLEDFSKGLSNIFASASNVIELSIARGLYERLGRRFEPIEGFNFIDYVVNLENDIRRS